MNDAEKKGEAGGALAWPLQFGVSGTSMTYNPETHHRNSIRLKEYDYAAVGAYFVTICAFQRECLFGEIVEGDMRLNDAGVLVRDEWLKTPALRQNVCLDEFVVMPNHFHGIVNIVEAHCMRPIAADMGMEEKRLQVGMDGKRAHVSAPLRRQSGSIGSILAGKRCY